MNEILRIEGLSKTFTKKGFFHSGTDSVLAVNNVSFSLMEGEVLALVGQSGSGKSTIAKLILRSIEPDAGKIFFKQKEISKNFEHLKKFRSKCQMIHQDPYDSINPRMKIFDIVSEPLEIHNKVNSEEKYRIILETLKLVKLEPAEEIIEKFPHMLSGGQRQRVAIARALGLQLEGPAEKFLHPLVPIFHFSEHSYSMAGDFSAFIHRDFPPGLPTFYRALGASGIFLRCHTSFIREPEGPVHPVFHGQ